MNVSTSVAPPPPASGALATLLAQHDALRARMDRCEDLAAELAANPVGGPHRLEQEAAALRVAFDAHNEFEEQLLRPMILAHEAFATLRIDRMLEDHVGEHREYQDRLGGVPAADLRDVIHSLRGHLRAEERYLLTSPALRPAAACP